MINSELHETIRTQRTDPITGTVFTFTAEPPTTPIVPNTESKVKEYVLSVLWQTLLSHQGTDNYPQYIHQAIKIIPVLEEFVLSIDIDLSEPDETTQQGEKYNYTYSIKYSKYTSPSSGDYVAEPPSDELLTELATEVLHSEPVFLLVHHYINTNKKDLERQAEAEKATTEKIKTGGLPLEKGKRTKSGDKSTSQLKKVDPKQKDIMMSVHSMSQRFHVAEYTKTPTETAVLWNKYYGVAGLVDTSISKYGIDLTEIQSRVLDGLLSALTTTNYKGSIEPVTKDDMLQRYGVKKVEDLPAMHRNIEQIPRIKVGKRELLRLSGMSYDSQRDVERVVQAIEYLGVTQFCFYYTRMAYDKNGVPEKDKNGDYKKESVTATDTLFKVQVVRDELTQVFKYYEIEPSGIFLDQMDKYYMLIPFDWREEVRAKVGNKKASSYLYLFLLYLRYQFEQKRRKNRRANKDRRLPYEIKGNWVSMAQSLRIPEIVYKRNPARVIRLLEDAYSAAVELGYLTNYTRDGLVDTLVLNPEKYPRPKSETIHLLEGE